MLSKQSNALFEFRGLRVLRTTPLFTPDGRLRVVDIEVHFEFGPDGVWPKTEDVPTVEILEAQFTLDVAEHLRKYSPASDKVEEQLELWTEDHLAECEDCLRTVASRLPAMFLAEMLREMGCS